MKTKDCGPCRRSNNASDAYKFCTDCDESLCQKCYKIHGTFKPLITHSFDVISDLTLAPIAKDTISVIENVSFNTCSDHKNSKYEYYCSGHRQLCCKICVKGSHKFCGRVQPIDNVSSEVIDSKNNDKFLEHLSDTKDELRSIYQSYIEDVNKINSTKDKIRTKIEEFRSEIIHKIDDVTTNLLNDLETTCLQCVQQIGKDTDELKTCANWVNETRKVNKSALKSGDKNAVFIAVESYNEKILPRVQRTLEKSKDKKVLEVEFIRFNVIPPLNSIGRIEANMLSQPTSKTNIKPQRPLRQVYVPTKFKHEKNFDLIDTCTTKNLEITGMASTKDCHLILCNKLDSKLLICSEQLDLINEIALSGRPWTLATDNETGDDVWVTLPDIQCIQHVTLSTMSADPVVRVPPGSYGIALIEDNIALGRWSEVQIINREGVCLKRFDVGKSTIHSLLLGNNRSLYCCEGDEGMFHSIDYNTGITKFTFMNEEFRWPVNAALDVQNNVYVLGLKSHNLQRLTPLGKCFGEMLTDSDELNFPRCLTFSKDYSKLFVVNNLGKSVSVYTCQYV